jgi:Protein of unknown function (DUF3108)
VNGRQAVGVASFFVAILQTSPPIANADYIPPSQVVVRTKAYQPQETNFPLGSYDYQISWQGIPVGSASIRVGTTYRDGKEMLDVEATACSGRVVSLFYKLRHRSESIFSAQELKPVEFLSQQTENSRFTNLKIDFSPDGSINAKIDKGRLNSAGKSEEVSFKSENTTFDPISAAFLARSLPVDPAEDLSFDVFNGEDRYLISLHVVGREKIKVAGKEYDALKIAPLVKKLTDTEGERRLRKVYLWVSTDGRREVLKLESEVLIGSVSAKLVRFVPDTSPEADMACTYIARPFHNE